MLTSRISAVAVKENQTSRWGFPPLKQLGLLAVPILEVVAPMLVKIASGQAGRLPRLIAPPQSSLEGWAYNSVPDSTASKSVKKAFILYFFV